MKKFSIIVAMDDVRGIGKGNSLAWHLSADLKHFKNITTDVSDPLCKNAVIMGRNTWESLPSKVRPLPGRLNIVLTRQKDLSLPSGVYSFSSIDESLEFLSRNKEIQHVFVIGGAQVYAHAIFHQACEQIIVTELKGAFNCDAFFPQIPSVFTRIDSNPSHVEGGLTYRFLKYVKS